MGICFCSAFSIAVFVRAIVYKRGQSIDLRNVVTEVLLHFMAPHTRVQPLWVSKRPMYASLLGLPCYPFQVSGSACLIAHCFVIMGPSTLRNLVTTPVSARERVLLGDRNCSTVITRDAGYCECVGGVTTKR